MASFTATLIACLGILCVAYGAHHGGHELCRCEIADVHHPAGKRLFYCVAKNNGQSWKQASGLITSNTDHCVQGVLHLSGNDLHFCSGCLHGGHADTCSNYLKGRIETVCAAH